MLKSKTKIELTEIKCMKTDPIFGTLSKAEAQARWRKDRELERRLELEKDRIKEEIDNDNAAPDIKNKTKSEKEDNTAGQGTSDIPDLSGSIIPTRRGPGRPTKS